MNELLNEKETFNWLLIKKENGAYLGWSKAEDEPPCGEPDLLEWVTWGEELPEDIDAELNPEPVAVKPIIIKAVPKLTYTLKKGKLTKEIV